MTASVKFRRVPGYFNSSTYWFDLGAEFIGTVKKVGEGGWDKSPTWRAWTKDAEVVNNQIVGGTTAYGRTRALAVDALLRKVKAKAIEDDHTYGDSWLSWAGVES